ncbi:hypothetical protein O181_046811 [Austropuccinia psidii MF-1]|uniref:Uncharacterized protein n=1 Tax=Austropuccinia psidii MF-1 TaxID=1389203 RepID=A0A9Q3DUY9_9BASI|nr:hypothetical protein [Austropuccinia psidii MF-1]
MTPTRSGSNYSIQSNGSGPGNASHKSKRQEFQPRGEAQMEDARTSTSSKRLASTFDTLIEGPEADIIAITAVRPEPFPTSNNRDIPVSVKELVYGRKQTGVGTSEKKDRGPSEGSDTHVLQRTSPTDKSLVEKPKHFVRGAEAEVGQGKENSPVEAPQASTSKNLCQQVPKKGNQPPKSNQKGKKNAKGKAKRKWNKPFPQNYRISKKEKTAMDNVFNMARTLMEFRNKEEERVNQYLPKK